MTKEEALKQNVPLYFSSDYDGPGEEAKWHTSAATAESIYKSMDQYADIQSIGLSEWASLKYVWIDHDKWQADDLEIHTTAELLTLYKQSI